MCAKMQKRETAGLLACDLAEFPWRMSQPVSLPGRELARETLTVSCKQEPSTLRGRLLGMGAFSGVCFPNVARHRAEGRLPHLGLSLLFLPKEGNSDPETGEAVQCRMASIVCFHFLFR